MSADLQFGRCRSPSQPCHDLCRVTALFVALLHSLHFLCHTVGIAALSPPPPKPHHSSSRHCCGFPTPLAPRGHRFYAISLTPTPLALFRAHSGRAARPVTAHPDAITIIRHQWPHTVVGLPHHCSDPKTTLYFCQSHRRGFPPPFNRTQLHLPCLGTPRVHPDIFAGVRLTGNYRYHSDTVVDLRSPLSALHAGLPAQLTLEPSSVFAAPRLTQSSPSFQYCPLLHRSTSSA